MAYFRRFWVKKPRHSETLFAKKRYTSILAHVSTISDDFGLRSPRHSETIFAKKRYTSMVACVMTSPRLTPAPPPRTLTDEPLIELFYFCGVGRALMNTHLCAAHHHPRPKTSRRGTSPDPCRRSCEGWAPLSHGSPVRRRRQPRRRRRGRPRPRR